MGSGKRRLQAVDANGGLIGRILTFRKEVDLVAEVTEVVIDRGGREQQHLGLYPALDDVIHKSLITAFANDVALFIPLASGVVSEVVRFINDDQVKIAPIESF